MKNDIAHSSEQALYKILYYALIGIREEAYDIKNARIYRLSDFVHNLPLRISNANSISDYDDLLKEMKRLASEMGLDTWLIQNLEQDE